MLLQNKKVAIVGGGPGGLTLARLLQLKGVDVKVYERDLNKEARVQGSPLDLHDQSGLAAIIKANLLNEFKANFLPGADRKIISNKQAEVLYSDHKTKLTENFGHEHFRPEIDRGALRKILLESLQPETVVWDSHFLSMEAKNEGWILHFKNGLSAYADLVIAADGTNSKIRSYVTPVKAVYSGITMVELNIYDALTNAPHIYNWLNGGKVMAFGDSKCILGGQKGDGAIGVYLSLKTGENWANANDLDYDNPAQFLEWFRKEYLGWSPFWEELFENPSNRIVPRPIYYMPLDQDWAARSNVTLIGDAAHAMPPFAGEGANMAMLDALELSGYLTSKKYTSVKDAISAYETTMRKRGASAAKESIDNGEMMHAEDALEKMLVFFGSH